MSSAYHPEPYWNDVARHIAKRGHTLIAGDDEPYYRYKRRRFLRLFHTIDFKNKAVLEVGPGPGGNLAEAAKAQPALLCGADISEAMIAVAQRNLAALPVSLFKTDGHHLPFADRHFDITYTVTVLQHNTDEAMLCALVTEMARVTKDVIYIFERIDRAISGTDLCRGRPVTYYEKRFGTQGFKLETVRFLNIEASYYVSGAIRKLFNKRMRAEGAPVSRLSATLQHITLPFTSVLDRLLPVKREVAMLCFRKA